MKVMHKGTKSYVKRGETVATSYGHKQGGEKGVQFKTTLVTMFINGIMEYIKIDNSHAPSIGRTLMPGLLFADDLTASH